MTHHRYIATNSPRRQRGAGALIVVLVLFFVISLVAAYSSRNMIFEQKTSANQYRSTQAFEAAEAGVEWALAMLNTGRIDSTCQPSTNVADSTFRQRYLSIDPSSGAIAMQYWSNAGTPTQFHPTCVRAAAGWTCSCPDNGAPVLAAPTTAAPAPAFRLTFNVGGKPGVFALRSQACTRLDSSCLNDSLVSGQGDAVATVNVLIALKGAISTPPVAALSAGAAGTPGAVNLSGAATQVTNTEPLVNGVTIDASGAVAATGIGLNSVPGSPAANSIVQNDSALPSTADLLFASVFGMSRTTYQQQPATISLNCATDDCSAAGLQVMAASNPGRILWIQGDVSLDSAVTIGTPTAPAVLVVNGNLTATVPVTINGLVYGIPDIGASNWTLGGSPVVIGAVVAEGSVNGTGTPSLTYNLPVLNALRVTSGSFVRVPGSWRDF